VDALAADHLLKRYLSRSTARALLGAPDSIKVLIPLTGLQSLVRLIEVDGRPRAVARIFPPEEAASVERRKRAAELLADNGLAAPEVLDAYPDGKTGAVLLLEAFIEGPHPDPATITSPEIRALADTFARLHAVTSDRIGPFDEPKRGSLADEAKHRTTNRSKSVKRWAPPGIDRSTQKPIVQWLSRAAQSLDRIERCSLTHDKPNVGNLIWDEKQSLFRLIDLETLRYGASAKDLTQILHEPLGDREETAQEFLGHYFEIMGNAARDEFNAVEPFHHGYYHLAQCAINCRRGNRYAGDAEQASRHEQKALDHWWQLVRIVESNTD
jgi:aminoglycoside phosphotransferase (APT) family kinase protein